MGSRTSIQKDKIATRSKTKGKPNSMDEHVGARLRLRRGLIGISQEKLAEAIGLTFQQIQKYERGANRISAGRLHDFARILDVPVTYFFESFAVGGKEIPLPGLSDTKQEGFSSSPSSLDENLLNNRETLDLLKLYYSVPDPKQRREILRLVRTLVANIRPAAKTEKN